MININKLAVFTDEVFYFDMPNFTDWKKQIEQIILIEENNSLRGKDDIPQEECNVKAKRTGFHSHLKYPALHNLCNYMKNILKDFIDKEQYDIPNLIVVDCWINWYEKNQHAIPHAHKPYLSVVFFVDVEDSKASFFFHSDKNFILQKKKNNELNYMNTMKKINVKNGTVVFFDGILPHSVSPNLSNKRRVTVALNFRAIYTEDRNEY